MKHPVIVKVKKPKKFVYLGLGSSYKDKNDKGRKKVLKDINGEETEFIMRSPAMVLDISDSHEKKIYDWLMSHPTAAQHLSIEDTIEKQTINTKKMVKSAEAIQIAVSMKDKDVLDFAKLVGIRRGDNSVEFIKAQVIKMANDSPDKFSRVINDRDKAHRVFIENALDAKLIVFTNGTYKHNKETIGITEDQVIQWLKDNKDVYALLKKELKK